MSCEEVRAYLESGDSLGTALVSRPAVEEHIVSCPECAGFRDRQEQLRASFDLVRERTPSIPPSLDQKVLASYRQHIRALAEARRPQRPVRRYALWALAWASAAAFALAIAYAEITWFTRAPEALKARVPVPMRAVSQAPSTEVADARPRASATRAAEETTPTKPFAARAREQGGPPAQSDGGSGFLPVGFRGLMYCDELSCAGAMDVIRVEVPAGALGFPLRARPGSQPVEADVLVGPDGVARGIRVVE